MIDGIINNGERKTDKEVQTDKPSVLGQLSQAKKNVRSENLLRPENWERRNRNCEPQ